MEEAQFPPENLVSAYAKGDSERILVRFELFDEDGKYVRLAEKKGAISVCGELMPTAAGKKENKEVKPVTMVLSDNVSFSLKRGATAEYWAETPTAKYLLASPLSNYADWWQEEAMQLKLIPLLERELGSKNPRSLEQVMSRLSREVPGLQNDLDEFADRFGEFVLHEFGSHSSDLLGELRLLVDARGASRADWLLPDDGDRLREVDRDCTKGNEWAAKLLGLALPVRTVPKKRTEKREKRPRSLSTMSIVAGGRRAKYPTEDMLLEGAASHPKVKLGSPIQCKVPLAGLGNLFTVSAFVSSFGGVVLGHETPIEPSQIEAWVVASEVSLEFSVFMSDLMTFIGNEGKDPSVRGFGASTAAQEELPEEVNNEEEEEDDVEELTTTPIVSLGRLRRLVLFVNRLTYGEILRRFLHVFRAELPRVWLHTVSLALERYEFASLDPVIKLEVLAFLVKKCLQSKRISELIDESQHHISAFKAERAKLIKDIRAKFAPILKKKVPPKPATEKHMVTLKAKIDLEESALEKLRLSGEGDRKEMSRASKSITLLKREYSDQLEELQEVYDEVALAGTRRDEEIAEVNEEFDPKIREEKALMRFAPLGQDRFRRNFWFFEQNRDSHDVVYLHDAELGAWSVIQDMEELKRFRNRLEVRGIREKTLHDNIDQVIPRILEHQKSEAEILESSSKRSGEVRIHAFGRILPSISVDDDKDVVVVEGEKKESKPAMPVPDGPLDEAAQLSQMQAHLIKTMHELPKGCVKSENLERVAARVDSTKNAVDLASVLCELEECVTSGWMMRSWSKDRIQWLDACQASEIAYPTFALLLYMLEFSVDRYYNPSTGRSEKPTGRAHHNQCQVCDKIGQLILCDTCPRVYHLHCLDPPLLHIPAGDWHCDKCMRFRPEGRIRPHRSSSRLAKNSSDLDLDAAIMFAARNPTRSSRAAVRYAEPNEDDDDEEDDEPIRKKSRRKKVDDDEDADVDDEDDDEEGNEEEDGDDEEDDSDSSAEFGKRRRSARKSRGQPTRKQPRRGRRNGSDDEDDEDGSY